MKFVAERIKGLNESDGAKVWAEVETIAGELDSCLCKKLSEDLSAEFVDMVMRVRSHVPEATTFGVFAVLISTALMAFGTAEGVKSLIGTKGARVARHKPQARRGIRGV